MTDKTSRILGKNEKALLEDEVVRLDEDLDIMEKHSDKMEKTEGIVQEEMRKRDREYKDSHLHSVPKPQKHVR